jgi:hypothetical protein
MRYCLAFISLTLAAVAHAAEESAPHPVLSSDGRWVPVILILIGGMFLAACAVGIVVRANAPEEVPPAHSHDEPPGTSHHHGRGGTVDPAPEDEIPPHGHRH